MKKARIFEALHNIGSFILDIPYEALDFLMAHKWAANLVGIVIGIAVYLITTTALVFLRTAGYIP